MVKILFLFFLLFSITNYGQCLSKIQVIYESAGLVVMNNGKEYQIVIQKPHNKVNDPSITKYNKIGDITLTFNRLILIKGNSELTELIEWKKDSHTYYETREILSINLKKKITPIIKTISAN
ncbi:hypothetical protein [uncultured Aquimarina sp.]|uniref:hypothetical protein n=1 Tax=uncultured Aquimarina sp. TaxID=575652 RepID=UPI0026261529|nr:hypothetical protein [uncultured Aquimarina sp.]